MNEDKTLQEAATNLQLAWSQLIKEIAEITRLDKFAGWLSKKLGE